MPKTKTRKTIAKRFKITSTGKVLRAKQYAGHRKFHKSKRLIRSYHKNVELNKEQTKQIKKLITS